MNHKLEKLKEACLAKFETRGSGELFETGLFQGLLALEPGWDSYDAEPPAEISVVNAIKIIETLGRPATIRPSAEGGVMIRYGDSSLGAYVECYNDGEIGYTLTDQRRPVATADIKLEGFEIPSVISKVRKHLVGVSAK